MKRNIPSRIWLLLAGASLLPLGVALVYVPIAIALMAMHAPSHSELKPGVAIVMGLFFEVPILIVLGIPAALALASACAPTRRPRWILFGISMMVLPLCGLYLWLTNDSLVRFCDRSDLGIPAALELSLAAFCLCIRRSQFLEPRRPPEASANLPA